jgi:hypothetical protein
MRLRPVRAPPAAGHFLYRANRSKSQPLETAMCETDFATDAFSETDLRIFTSEKK